MVVPKLGSVKFYCWWAIVNEHHNRFSVVTQHRGRQVDRILLKHTVNMLVELGVQGKNVATSETRCSFQCVMVELSDLAIAAEHRDRCFGSVLRV